jgi:hypothetical protein
MTETEIEIGASEAATKSVAASPASLNSGSSRSAGRIDFFARFIYPAALFASLSMWFLALRAPLWLDETLAAWQVSGGLARVWTRSALMPSSIGYLYTLWLAKSILGSSEMALKIPSLVALLGATYFLFRSARELFDWEIGFLSATFFALESNVVFAATDARPYAFALLASSVAIFAFIRWMKIHTMRQAVWFGGAAAGVLYFHYLFSSLLPAFAIYYLVACWRSLKQDLKQIAAAIATFAVLILPLIVRVASLYHTRDTHVVQPMQHPFLLALNYLAPMQTMIGFIAAAFVAAAIRKLKLADGGSFPKFLLFPLLALVPAAVLFAVSAVTPAHLVIPRYMSVVAPGAALTWALLTSRIDSRALRMLFCAGLVVVTCCEVFPSPAARKHEINFKEVHAFVNANVGNEGVAVLEASAFIESNYEPLPGDPPGENALFSQAAYYPVRGRLIFLPMALNDEAMRIARETEQSAWEKHQRFLVVSGPTSFETIQWMLHDSRGRFTARVLKEFDQILLVEFRPVAEDAGM